MRKVIMKYILIIILISYPTFIIKSSNRLSLKFDFNDNDIKKINEEYIKFYNKLYSDDLKEENIKFILNLKDYALNGKSLPSIAIAQAILETGYGKSKKLEHNIFGIKGKGILAKTKEYYNNKFHVVDSAEFQKFNSISEAFDRHYEIISRCNFNNRDYNDWAKKIKKYGYATDPLYAEKLIYLIKKHDLYRLDIIQELKNNL